MTLKTVKSVKSGAVEPPRTAPSPVATDVKEPEISGSLGFIDLYEVEEVLPNAESPILRAKQIGARVDAVVLRPLPKAVRDEPELLGRLREEMARLIQLRHPNVVSLLGFHCVEEVRYSSGAAQRRVGVEVGDWLLVAAFAPGMALDAWRAQFPETRASVASTIEIVRQLCGALDYAHRRKVFHLDLKPPNVIVESKNGGRFTVRVMDFCPTPEKATFDENASVYTAPELKGAGMVSQAADQFSVATLFLELVTGDPDRASAERLEPKVRRVVLRALAENPSERFPSCGAFARALELAGTRKGRTPLHYAVLAVLSVVAVVAVWRALAPSKRDERVLVASEAAAKAQLAAAEAQRKAAETARLEMERRKAEEKAAAEERARLEEVRKAAERKAMEEKAIAEAKAKEAREAEEKARLAELKALEEKVAAEKAAEEKAATEKAAALQAALEKSAEERRQATARAHARFRAADWAGVLDEARKGDLGDAELQWEVGTCLLDGLGTTTNLPGAVSWIRKSADQGWPAAQVRLGELMLEGRGVESNGVRAVALFRAAAERGNAAAHWELSQCMERGVGMTPVPGEAARHLEAAARAGHPRAQYTMGVRSLDGKAAAEWLRKSAEQGYAPAQSKYGDCLSYGNGVERNLKQAVVWYTRAADRGDAAGQRALGLCYDNGQGVKEDGRRAAALYRDAATGGDLLAKALYSQCLFLGLGGVPRDGAEAWRLARSSADGGCAFGQYMAGLCCETGTGTIRSRLNAKLWYEKAILQGLDCARVRLDRMQIK